MWGLRAQVMGFVEPDGAGRRRVAARPRFCGTRVALFLAVLLNLSAIVRAEMPTEKRKEVLAGALAAFDRGTELALTRPGEALAAYRRAEELFASLVDDGVENGKLYYNLGNTYLQLGRLGKAIVNYRRAEALIGSDPQLQANLHYARSLRRNQIQRSGEKELLRTVFFWHYDTLLQRRYLVAVGAYVVFWFLLITRTFVRQTGLGYAALVFLIIWVAAGVSVAVETAERRSVREGVTVRNDIVVRKGNGDGYDPQFKESLHEGVEFIVVEERPGWYKIELPDGNTGWLRQAQAEII